MYIMGVDPTAAWTSSAEHALGSLGANITAQGTKTYRYVKLANETATVAVAGTSTTGEILAYLAAPASDDEINTVVSDFTDAETIPVGAGMAFAAIAGVASTAYYGWVQTTGYAISVKAIGGTGDNDALICGGDMILTVATAVTDPICAICIVDATKNVRLTCP